MVEVLSDTGGSYLGPYLAELVRKVKTRWYNEIPAVAMPPTKKEGKVVVQFKVMGEGKVTEAHFVKTSGDAALDAAAYDSIVGQSPLPPLPDDFTCQFLALQFHFFYNPAYGVSKTVDLPKRPTIPCVQTKISMDGEHLPAAASTKPVLESLSLAPTFVQLKALGGTKFTAPFTATADYLVIWTASGPDCKDEGCGWVSSGGFYSAPGKVDHPTVVYVRAKTPKAIATATVLLVPTASPR